MMCMEINEDLVTRLEHLSRLKLSAGERAQMIESLRSIVDMFGIISQVDTEGVEPLLSMSGVANVMREDKTVKGISVDEALANAPAVVDQYFAVPKVIE